MGVERRALRTLQGGIFASSILVGATYGQNPSAVIPPSEADRKITELGRRHPSRTKEAETGTDNGGKITLRQRGGKTLLVFSVGLSDRFVNDSYYCQDNHLVAYRRDEARIYPTPTKAKTIRLLSLDRRTGEIHSFGEPRRESPDWSTINASYHRLTIALRSPVETVDQTQMVTGK